ncbi:hypothetical protein PAPYR_12591 [Paratrimastix pyriformis]|uniref:Uncharacterized protein n=1 Tax=Paratrimastix pyriformis TaxID=342808 RepID=A0ABQ8U1M5_9EUKA|nr:hypothetical protein PAPYR_12591 [Paratrimastix pyriformis]
MRFRVPNANSCYGVTLGICGNHPFCGGYHPGGVGGCKGLFFWRAPVGLPGPGRAQRHDGSRTYASGCRLHVERGSRTRVTPCFWAMDCWRYQQAGGQVGNNFGTSALLGVKNGDNGFSSTAGQFLHYRVTDLGTDPVRVGTEVGDSVVRGSVPRSEPTLADLAADPGRPRCRPWPTSLPTLADLGTNPGRPRYQPPMLTSADLAADLAADHGTDLGRPPLPTSLPTSLPTTVPTLADLAADPGRPRS